MSKKDVLAASELSMNEAVDFMAEVKEDLLESVPYLLRMPSTRIWIDYDDEADVLYISFQKPQHADESELKENIICHYRGAELVGITVIGAKNYQKRLPEES